MKSLSNRDLKKSLNNTNEIKNSKLKNEIIELDLISPNIEKNSKKSLTLNKRSNSNNKVNLKFEDSTLNSQSNRLLSDVKNEANRSSHSPIMTNKKRQFSKTSTEMTGDKVIVMYSKEIDNNELLRDKVTDLTFGINKLCKILHKKDKLICNISEKLEKSLSNNFDLRM